MRKLFFLVFFFSFSSNFRVRNGAYASLDYVKNMIVRFFFFFFIGKHFSYNVVNCLQWDLKPGTLFLHMSCLF